MMLPWSWLRARSRRLWPTRIGEAAAVITAWVLLSVAAVLVVGNAVFVAAETALVTVDRNLVESQAHEGSVRFGRVRGTLQRLSTYLSGAQLGITVTSLAIGLVAEPSIATLLRGPLEALGLDADVTEVAALALALLLATAVGLYVASGLGVRLFGDRLRGVRGFGGSTWLGTLPPGGCG
jgi:hypothetical protein